MFVLGFWGEMASLTETELGSVPGATESIVPACMFAPDHGCGMNDPSGGEGFEDGEGTNGESADHLDFSNKVGQGGFAPAIKFTVVALGAVLLKRIFDLQSNAV